MGVFLSTPAIAQKQANAAVAMEHLSRAAQSGVVRAWFYLAVLYGQAYRPADLIRCVTCGAEAGDPQAQAVLGYYYSSGTFVAKDQAVAEKWTRLAAESGSPQYMRGFGEILQARGTEDAARQAVEWIRKAAERDDRKAQHELALAMLNGTGIDMDVAGAVALLRSLTQQNVPEAKLTLGKLYCEGIVVDRDLREAQRLFEEAAAARVVEAGRYLRWLKSMPESPKAGKE
jgi:TPR repeat protein